MIPYWTQPILSVGPLAVPSFYVLVLLGSVIGFELVVRRSEQIGMARARAAVFAAITLLTGFVGSHLFAELAYAPKRAMEHPEVLLWVWGGISSVGGMLSGLAGACAALWWTGATSRQTLGFLDLLGFAAPFGWTFGRIGCALAHDHLGGPSDSWLAVQFPDGPRLDLGLLEVPVHVAIAGVFLVLARRPRAPGTFIGLFFLLYGPARFMLEELRVGEPTYLGLTPAQWFCAVAATVGAGVVVRAHRGR